MRISILGALSLALVLFTAGAASASPITMTPDTVTINSLIHEDFTLTFDGGDTVDNVLDFTIEGKGGCGFLCPSAAAAAMVFDDVDVVAAGDTVGGLFNEANVIRGTETPGGNLVALLLDYGAASSESFWAELSATPSTATIYALSVDDLDDVKSLKDILESVVDETVVTFSSSANPVPEPSAALVFAAGLLLARGSLRRRR